MVLNVIIALGAVASIAIGIAQRDNVEHKLRSLCSSCSALYIVYMFFFGALVAVALLGFFALCSRNVCLRSIYFICLLVSFVAVLVVCIMYTLLVANKVGVEGVWNWLLKKDNNELCDTQLELNCSGWLTPCNTANASGKLDKCPVCTDEQQTKINLFTETCETVILAALKDFAKLALPVGFTIVIVLLIAMITACLVRR